MYPILAAALLFVALGSSGPATSSPVVYLDPVQQGGHAAAGQIEGGHWAFEMALALKDFLSQEGASAVIANPDGRFLSLEERVASARLRRASAYIAIRTTEQPEACLFLYLPLQQRPSRADHDLGGLLDRLAAENKSKMSACLADSIERTISEAGVCVRRKTEGDRQTAYLLTRVDSAIIAVELAGSSGDDKRFGLDKGQKTRVARAISSGIAKCVHPR
jgi:N-acetylmuramoyl-L-alanine amidase